MSEIIDIEGIQKIIPHRYPFLLIDRIIEIKGSESIKGYKNVTINEGVFQGHFPRRPVFPGVLIIEAMAQLGAVLIMRRFPEEDRMAYFAGIDKARFKKVVVPGDRLDFEVIVTRDRGTFAIVEGKAYVDNQVVTEATLMCSVSK